VLDQMTPVATTSESHQLELGQYKVRMGVVLAIWLWFFYWFVRTHQPQAAFGLELTTFSFIPLSLQYAWIKKYPGYYPLRRLLSILFDQSMVLVGMFFAGALGSFFMFVNPFITIGNGIRFGIKWMTISSAVASVGIAAVGLSPGYWNQHPMIIFNLLILNLIIPAYISVLVRGLENARAELAEFADRLKDLAMKDPLTGLQNRPALIEELIKLSNTCQRETTSLAVLYFDLDGFKAVNDTFGHTLGDALLREVATRVRTLLRVEDAYARVGGDEFIILLKLDRATDRSGRVAERILETVTAIETLENKPINVSASIGCITLAGGEAARLGPEQLIKVADKNMYEAKKRGKNQAVLTELGIAGLGSPDVASCELA